MLFDVNLKKEQLLSLFKGSKRRINVFRLDDGIPIPERGKYVAYKIQPLDQNLDFAEGMPVYFGSTSQFELRLRNHIAFSYHENNPCQFYNYLKSNNINNILVTWEVFPDKESAKDREKFLTICCLNRKEEICLNINIGGIPSEAAIANRKPKTPPKKIHRGSIVATPKNPGNLVMIFKNLKDATHVLKLNKPNIVAVLNGRLKTTGGWVFYRQNECEINGLEITRKEA